MVYKEIEIDSTWQQPLGEIRVIQEEADGRKLIIHLYDNGTPLDLTGKTVSIILYGEGRGRENVSSVLLL